MKELFFHFIRMICFGSHFLSSFQNCSKRKGFDVCTIDSASSKVLPRAGMSH